MGTFLSTPVSLVCAETCDGEYSFACCVCPGIFTMPKEPRESAKLYWVFTVNNPDFLSTDLPEFDKEAYVSWQLEQGQSGTPHVQGYLECRTRVRLTQLKKWLPTAHFEPRRGTAEQAREYTRKEEGRLAGPYERGVWNPTTQGQRSDLQECQAFIEEGHTEVEVARQFPDIFARHPQFIRFWLRQTSLARAPKSKLEHPRRWQSHCLEILSLPADDRKILWLYDPVGAAGKTALARHLVDQLGAFYTNGGKHTDICHAYNGESIVVFDYVRESENYVNYGVMEQIKNGILFSPKYESGMKRFEAPHLVVFANFLPTTGKLSEDRLVCIKVEKCGHYEYMAI